MTVENIPKRIKRIRETISYSQKQMCEFFHMSQSNYTKIENGHLNPNLEFMLILRTKFNINLNWLIAGEGEMYIRDSAIDDKDKAISILLNGKPINEDIERIMDSLDDKLLVNEMIKALTLVELEPAFKKYLLEKEKGKEGKKVMVGGEKG